MSLPDLKQIAYETERCVLQLEEAARGLERLPLSGALELLQGWTQKLRRRKAEHLASFKASWKSLLGPAFDAFFSRTVGFLMVFSCFFVVFACFRAGLKAQFLRSNALERALEALKRNERLKLELQDRPLFAAAENGSPGEARVDFHVKN